MSKSPLISIIVPVYNTEKYLQECLESLINQTYSNLEIIVVNDGSIDKSPHILKNYQKKDSRITILEQSNKGVSEARNYGIKVAKGECIMFVDSDDWIDKDTCERLIQSLTEHDADIVLCSYLREFGKGIKKSRFILPKEKLYNEQETQGLRLRLFGLNGEDLKDPSQADTLGTIYSKLFRAEIIKKNHIAFIDLKITGSAEDVLFNIDYFKYVKSAFYLHQCLYHHRKINETSETTLYRPQLFNQWQNLFRIINSKIETENSEIKFRTALQNRIAISIFGLGLNILASEKNHLQKIRELKTILSSTDYVNAYSQINFSYFPFHWKVFFLFAKYKFAIGVYFLLNVIKVILFR